MIGESLERTPNIGREQLNVELTEVPPARVVGKSFGRKCKTGKKVRFEEEFDESKVIEESTIHQIDRVSVRENKFQDGSNIGEQSEITRKGDQTTPPKEKIIIEREAETNDLGEVGEAQMSSSEIVAVDEDILLPDIVTPSIKLIVFNIILPTIDVFLDAALVQKLFLNGYLGCGAFVTCGIVTNFLFTSLAWWRMESAEQKKWSWIFLLLQLWPQLRAFQVEG